MVSIGSIKDGIEKARLIFRVWMLTAALMRLSAPHFALSHGVPHKAVLYRQRHKVDNMFGKLKDWRRVRTRYGDARAPSCPPSASSQPSPRGYGNES